MEIKKTKSNLIKEISKLHEDFYTYSNLKISEKLLVVSAILMVLSTNTFDINSLNGNGNPTDGELIYDEIQTILSGIEFDEVNAKNILLEQFTFLKQTKSLNEINTVLTKTPLRYFTEILSEKHFLSTFNTSNCIGDFYNEFIGSSYGQGLGIALTPSHIIRLVVELLNIKKNDIILDPCAGTAGFLIEGLRRELKNSEEINTDKQSVALLSSHLHGFENQQFMFTLAIINMIIHGTKKIHLLNCDFLSKRSEKLRKQLRATVGIINPPYALGSSNNPSLYELNFVKQLLDSVVCGGRVAAIVPASSMTGKTKEVKAYKKEILEKHTLEGVITLNPDTFYDADIQAVIAIFTVGIPHPKGKVVKFIDFKEDGYKVFPHKGLIATDSAKERMKYLLDVWNENVDVDTKFCVKTCIADHDEWLHSGFYFRNEIPSPSVFDTYAKNYLIFRCSSILKGHSQLFSGQPSFSQLEPAVICSLEEKRWHQFTIEEVFNVFGTKVTQINDLIPNGTVPRICCSRNYNGIEGLFQNLATEPGNVLTVESAAIGSIHYQQVPFIASSHIEKLSLKDYKLNVFLGLFLSAAISFAIEGKYNYGYKFNKPRIRRQTILLPVNNENEIDYIYMEEYMKSLLKEKWNLFFQNY